MKVLTSIECMSGSGWITDDGEFDLECPNCSGEIDVEEKKQKVICNECNTKLSIKRGVINMIKLEVEGD